MQNRFFILTVAGLCLAGCVGFDEDYDANLDTFEGCPDIPGHPFGSHPQAYTAAAILPSGTQAELDDAVSALYDNWKGRYLMNGSPCGAGQYWVATGMGDKATVSEAHGYGMMITAFMAGYDPDAQNIFDGMYRYFREHPAGSNPDLMAWAQDYDCNDSGDNNSATDGDLDIAYGLLLADRQWGSAGEVNYRKEARKVLRAIMDKEVMNNRYILLADWVIHSDEHMNATRPSDFMPGHLSAFHAEDVTGLDGNYQSLMDNMYDILLAVRDPQTGLVPDFVINPLGTPEPSPPSFLEDEDDGMYGYNSCRVPWRIGVHYLLSGDERARDMLETMATWLEAETGGDPANIMAGYDLDGTAYNDYNNFSFTAPFALAAMVSAEHQSFLDAIWAEVGVPNLEWGSYYSDSLQMLSAIAISGNWWTPEDDVCP